MSQLIKQEERYVAQNYAPLPVVLVKGDGCRVWDENGKEYLDFLSAYSAVSFGHNNAKIKAALLHQMERLDVPSRAFYHDQLAPFAKTLCEITGMDKMLPMNSGVEAVETAIKAARRWGYRVKDIPTDQAEIIVATNNFHGRTTSVISFSTEEEYKKDFGPHMPGFKYVPLGDVAALAAAITPNTCAFLTEPMQGEGGIMVPPAGWLKQVQEVCATQNVLLILDEIQTGMGRTGKNFAFQHELTTPPDGLLLGKALGGGIYPVSAFVAKAEVMDVFDAGSHGSTFGGNPIACAIGQAALALLQEENLAQRSADLGAYLREEVDAIQATCVTEVRGKGLWIGIDIDPTKADAHELCLQLMAQGVLAKETHTTVIRLAPPLTITKAEIDQAVKVLQTILGES